MPTPGSFEHKLMMRRLRKEAEVLKNELSQEQARDVVKTCRFIYQASASA